MTLKSLIAFIPGVKQFQKKKYIIGAIWLFATIVGYGTFFVGIIIHAIYISLYCKQEVNVLLGKSPENSTQHASQDMQIDSSKNDIHEKQSEPNNSANKQENVDYPYVENTMGGSVALIDDYIVMKKGKISKIANFFDSDVNELKIPVESINIVNYKESGILDGTLEFVYPGFVPRPNEIKQAQENVITFRGKECNQKFLEFKEIVEKRIREIRQESRRPSSSASLSDELAKLNELKEKGILSQEEFDAQKRKLLNM